MLVIVVRDHKFVLATELTMLFPCFFVLFLPKFGLSSASHSVACNKYLIILLGIVISHVDMMRRAVLVHYPLAFSNSTTSFKKRNHSFGTRLNCFDLLEFCRRRNYPTLVSDSERNSLACVSGGKAAWSVLILAIAAKGLPLTENHHLIWPHNFHKRSAVNVCVLSACFLIRPFQSIFDPAGLRLTNRNNKV